MIATLLIILTLQLVALHIQGDIAEPTHTSTISSKFGSSVPPLVVATGTSQ